MSSKKNNLNFLVILLSAIAIVFCTGGTAFSEDDKYLRVGMNADSPPFGYMEKGELVGMEIDLYKEAAKRMGKELKLSNLPFAGLFPGLQAKKWDAAGNTWVKKQRMEMMDFADPWIDAKIAFTVKKDGKVKSLEDLKGTKLGAQAGTADHAWLKNNMDKYGPYEIKTYDRTVDMIMDVINGRIDGYLRDKTRGLFQIRNYPQLEVGFPAGQTFMQAVAFRKDDPLRDEFNKIQNEMKKDGTLPAIYKKWLGVEPSPDCPAVKVFDKPYQPDI